MSKGVNLSSIMSGGAVHVIISVKGVQVIQAGGVSSEL